MAYPEVGRFSEPGLLILASLADGPKHGYAMIVDIRRMTGVKLGPGTLYGAIARLEERGLIALGQGRPGRHPRGAGPSLSSPSRPCS